MEYTETQKTYVRGVFRSFDDDDVSYVTLRDYEALPDSNPGGDLDVFVATKDYQRAIDQLHIANFRQNKVTREGSRKGLVARAIEEPANSIKLAITSPVHVIRLFHSGGHELSLRGQHKEHKLRREGVVIHLQNHLAYKSPETGDKVRVAPSVEEHMLDNRRYESFFWAPAPVDELVHLVCRGVFDHDGEFPEHYHDRCGELWQKVQENGTEDTLDSLLQTIFYRADRVVKQHIKTGGYDTIYRELVRFTDY